MTASDGRGGLRVPVRGIVVHEWPPEATARILDTGIEEVWKVVRTYVEVGRDWDRLRAAYKWLSDEQLRAAVEFAKRHAAVIEDHIRREYEYRADNLRREVEPRRP